MKINSHTVSLATIISAVGLVGMVIGGGIAWGQLSEKIANVEDVNRAQWERLNEIQKPIQDLSTRQAVTQSTVKAIEKTLQKVDKSIDRIIDKLDALQ